MKNILYIALAMLSILGFTACNADADVDVVALVEGEAGMIINVSNNSSGALLGSPEADVDLADASVTFSDDFLNFEAITVSGGFDTGDISRLEIYKSYNGGELIKIDETTQLPYTLTYTSIDEFVEGTGLSADDLRIGDVFTFSVKVVKNNGEVYSYGSAMGKFSLTINCSYDLNGTYTMTNTVCDNPQTVSISQNSDGTWYASQADGGLLQFCSSNTTIANPGSFAVGCGGVVDASGTNGGAQYCGSNGIGCIVEGTWNQEEGELVLTNSNTFFTWAAAEYTSTYVRQ